MTAKRNITIHKAKIIDNTMEIAFLEIMPDGSKVKTQKIEYTAPPHPDLISAFAGLNKHLAALCYVRNKEGKFDTENVICRGFSLKGEDEAAGITLSGGRIVYNNMQYAINTPFLRFEKGKEVYAEMEELAKALEVCEKEVFYYVVDGKHAVNPQGDLYAQTTDKVFFHTPDNVASAMAAMLQADATMNVLVFQPNDTGLTKAISQTDPEIKIANDASVKNFYERIIANPPMANDMDIDHIKKLYGCLKPGGRMVTLASKSTKGTKREEFRQWCDKLNAPVKEFENGSFSDAGAPVPTLMLIIDKL